MKQNLSNGKKRLNERGFSLIELMIAMAIFSIAMLGITAVQVYTFNTNGKNARYTQAAMLLQEQLEDFLVVYYTEGSDPGEEVTPSGTTFNNRYDFTWAAAATPAINNTAEITMSVSWDEFGKDRDLTAELIIPEY